MGMFDELKCEYPLPAHPEMQGRTFQTKSFDDPYMELYTLTTDGVLLGPDKQPTHYRGEVLFYDFEKPIELYPDTEMISFSALFTDGNLIDIRCKEVQP